MKALLLVILALTSLFWVGLSQNETSAEQIKVVTTIAPLEEMIRAVGGEKVSISVLLPPGAEPHTFEPAPSQMKQVAEADLYIQNGAGLEFWMDKILQVNDKMVVVDSSTGLSFISESAEEIDPHIWLSLRNAEVQVDNIYKGLMNFDPSNSDYYLQNRDAYLEELRALDSEMNQTFAKKKSKIFIVHHPAWTYFARDYSLQQISLQENEKEPGPQHLARIVDLARENNITVIFAEPEFNPKSAEVISREMNASVSYIDPLAGNYLDNLRNAAEKIAESMKE